MYIYNSFSEVEMIRTTSLKKVNGAGVDSNARNGAFIHNGSDVALPHKRKHRGAYKNILEQYCVTIKPKLYRSNSLSELPASPELLSSQLQHSKRVLEHRGARASVYGSSGDSAFNHSSTDQTEQLMNLNLRGNTTTKKPAMTSEQYKPQYTPGTFVQFHNENDEDATSVTAETTSLESEDINDDCQRGAAFPFKPTPSGNLKVQSNQVVFQSSTVGVLLADPTQAKVKVKFEGEPGAEYEGRDDSGAPLAQFALKLDSKVNGTARSAQRDENKGRTLHSLGYASLEPIDWPRVQLPKKQDLFQEFYRRILNAIHTDTIVQIGDQEFNCHRIVLQIYSAFFNKFSQHSEIEIPSENVTPEAFQTIYEWMVHNGNDYSKILRRDNVLDLFCASQFLSIKDLEDQCWSFIVNENLFNEDTAFALYREARSKGLSPVMDLMVPRVMRFFLPLVASTDFLELDADEAMNFLKSNYICVTSEIEVLMAGVRWLHGDWSSREKYTVEVMRCVRFGLISPWQLVDIKRNPDNAEVLEIVNVPVVQQMVDDGLAYVIIKYWYGNNSKNYYHWIDVLGLTEPAERNWIGEEKNHVTYKDFLKYLEQFLLPKDQMYEHMAMMQPPRRNDEVPGNLRGMESEGSANRPPGFDFPLPAALKCMTGRTFPNMGELLENKKKGNESMQLHSPTRASQHPPMRPAESESKQQETEHKHFEHSQHQHYEQVQHQPHLEPTRQQLESGRQRYEPAPAPRHPRTDRYNNQPHGYEVQRQHYDQVPSHHQHHHQHYEHQAQPLIKHTQQIHMCAVLPHIENDSDRYDPPEKDSVDEMVNTVSESSTESGSSTERPHQDERRHSVAASYLAAATAALSGSRRNSQVPTTPILRQPKQPGVMPIRGLRSGPSAPAPAPAAADSGTAPRPGSPDISLFNQSKESLAKSNLNKLSTSILGPSNKNYIVEGSLFHWDRETVLIFGGIDPHTPYGVGRNTGKDIYRFDPVTNVWEFVGDLPEPRHHHSVAFLRGRVYLVGGADPRDDDVRGKSVVVSTVWSYEPVTRSWYSENGLSIPRKNFGLVVHRMALYAIGGQDKKGRVLRSVEKFDPKTGSWSEVRSMGIARMAVASTKYREYIWVAGGMTGEKKRPVCKFVECYNSKTNEWTEIHCLRFPRCFSTLFAMNDKLYIVGGAGKVTEKDKTASSVGAIDVWDWQERAWKLETEMSIPRHGHALAYLGTQLIIIGGVTTIYMRALSNVESYCCERNAWIRGVTPLPSPLSGHGAVTLPPASLM